MRWLPWNRVRVAVVVSGVGALALAACGPGDDADPLGAGGEAEAADAPDEAGDPADGSLTALDVGTLPFGGNAPFWWAMEAGYWEEAGFEVEYTDVPSDTLAVAAVDSGELQFAFTNVMNVVMARAAGSDVQLVSVPSYSDDDFPDRGIFTNDPDVTAPRDLVGKTVACSNTPFDTNWLVLREWFRHHDVDPDDVDCTELPYPEMLTALEAGSVAAVAVIEPFYTMATEDGGIRLLGDFLAEVGDNASNMGVMARADWVVENEETVARFVDALNRAIADLAADSDLARGLIKENTRTSPDMVDRMTIPNWRTSFPTSSVELWGELAATDGLIEQPIPIEELVWSGAHLER